MGGVLRDKNGYVKAGIDALPLKWKVFYQLTGLLPFSITGVLRHPRHSFPAIVRGFRVRIRRKFAGPNDYAKQSLPGDREYNTKPIPAGYATRPVRPGETVTHLVSEGEWPNGTTVCGQQLDRLDDSMTIRVFIPPLCEACLAEIGRL